MYIYVWYMHTWIGGISGRQGRFSGLVTEGMSSMGPIMGLAGLRWAWAPAILALVGLVGLALCREATGKGPACPGFECCTKRRTREGEWSKEKKNDHRQEAKERYWQEEAMTMKEKAWGGKKQERQSLDAFSDDKGHGYMSMHLWWQHMLHKTRMTK